MSLTLDSARAQAFADTALANVRATYPFHLVHYARSTADIAAPDALHPAFHGSYDWHSCVHMHWTLLQLWQRFPALPQNAHIERHFDARLNPGCIAGELAYFEAPGRASFERPYGWGWLLKLHEALIDAAAADARAAGWRDALDPLAQLIAQRCTDFLGRSAWPVRTGTHGNSAFALVLALQWARRAQHPALAAAIRQRALDWYGRDRRYPADYEPGGDDFLSAGLCEAVLVQSAIDGCDWTDWWQAFEPSRNALANWLAPVAVSDPRDPKIVHLHGLNLSRAWCWRTLLPHLPAALQPAVTSAIDAHLAASLPAATAGDYVGTHWLASFALLALD